MGTFRLVRPSAHNLYQGCTENAAATKASSGVSAIRQKRLRTHKGETKRIFSRGATPRCVQDPMAQPDRFDSQIGEQRFQLLVNSVTDYAIYMLDAEGYVATWNPGARRFKGY